MPVEVIVAGGKSLELNRSCDMAFYATTFPEQRLGMIRVLALDWEK